MPFSLTQIKTFNTIDLDNFEIRGAKTGINNAQTTSPLYDNGAYYPGKTVLSGTATFVNGNATVSGISFNAPFSSLNAFSLVKTFGIPGDVLVVGSSSFTVTDILSSTSVVVDPVPAIAGALAVSFHLADRDYLVEPDISNNTTTRGLANFTQTDIVTGVGTTWLTDVAVGDAIQLNSYQKYFTVKLVISNTQLQLTQAFDGPVVTNAAYTIKKWRLDRLKYLYAKQYFKYIKNKGRWEHDSTTGSNLTAYDSFQPFTEGMFLQFTPSLKPATYPALMDSNLTYQKTLVKSTENPLPQYAFPAVPNPEESLTLYINDIAKDRFPEGNSDYVMNYWQSPVYEFPPMMSDRRVANAMFLGKVENVALSTADTALGTMIFTDQNGDPVPGIMPGSESISFSGADKTAYKDYVLDVNTGLGYSSHHQTNEAIVKYVNFQRTDLYEYGITITLNGVPQKYTIPHNDTDDVVFDVESGRLKPAKADNPALGQEYIVTYYTEGNFISDYSVIVTPGMTAVQLPSAVKYQSVIVIKNGNFLTDLTDFRTSYLTGRVILFTPLISGDQVLISYSPLIHHVNGITYENKNFYCKTYGSASSILTVSPVQIRLPNPAIVNKSPVITRVYNQTKALDYNLTGYVLQGVTLTLGAQTFTTDFSDVILVDYKFQNKGVEYVPVQTINFFLGQGTNYIAFINRNLISLFPTGTFIRLTNVDSAGDFFFRVAVASYDGYDTQITVDGTIPVDITNPIIYVSDAAVSFIPAPVPASIIASGTTDILFPGLNYSFDFRKGALLNIGSDYYSILGSQYDQSSLNTTVSLSVQSYQDYTSASTLNSVQISDCPLYTEGDSVISSQYEIITEPAAPVMSLNTDGFMTVTADSSAFSVDTSTAHYTFLYTSYPKISSLASALTGVGINVTSYVTDWTSSKIIPMTGIGVSNDSTTVVTAIPALRLFNVDTTDFSITAGQVFLNNPVVKGQRYNLDYLGKYPLLDSTVVFSANYFTILPAKSKISASFKFDNVDQFYLQILSQRNFLENVTQPRMKYEAQQQSGNVGQGGEIPGDEDQGNAEGGLINDEYRRKDAEIECRVFDAVFDFFNARVQDFGDEEYAMLGRRICNNDGLLSETDQSSGWKSVNRMFPWADYTSFPPYFVSPITGQTNPYNVAGAQRAPNISVATAQFTNGSPTVSTTSSGAYATYFMKQIRAGDFIRPFDTTTDYQIQTVNNDTQVTLTTNYLGVSENNPFIMTSSYPLYDDDGFTGAKIKGNKADGWGLSNLDVFDVTVDGVYQSYTFQEPPLPAWLVIPAPMGGILGSLFGLLSSLTPNQIASMLTTNLPGARVDYQWIFDPATAYGYKPVMIVRTKEPYNKIVMGSGAAVSKLGFIPGTTQFGNMNNTDADPEYYHLVAESADLASQLNSLSILLPAGVPDKLNRVTPSNLLEGVNIYNMAKDETGHIMTEMQRLNSEIYALSKIIQEPSMPGYAQAVTAYYTDQTFLTDCTPTLAYAQSIVANYQLQNTTPRWILDILPIGSTPYYQYVLGKDATNVAVPYNSGPGVTPIIGENSFILQAPFNTATDYDKRILNATVDNTNYKPVVTFIPMLTGEVSAVADGSWTTWDSLASDHYSINNLLTFHFNDTTGQFYLNYSPTTFTFDTSGNFHLFWDTSRSLTFNYATYPTVGSLKTVLNALAGLTTSGSSIYDGSSSYSIRTDQTTVSPSGTPIVKKSLGMFTAGPDSTLSFTYSVDTTAFNLYWDSTSRNLLFSSYPTIGALRTEIDNTPGIGTAAAGADSSGSSVLRDVTTSPLNVGTVMYDKEYTLFTLTADNIYSHAYYIDKSGVGMSWNGGSKYYDYQTYHPISVLKNTINADIPGLDATGSSLNDSSSMWFKPIGVTAIPPDATVYPALRNCIVTYWTLDDKNLIDRTNFDTTRKTNVDNRISFILTRESQITQNLASEEMFRATNGDTGNLYNWADNRFNRSNGCEARLKQIEKQMEMNHSSLQVSKRFL